MNTYDITHNSFYGNVIYNSIISDSRHKIKTGVSVTLDTYDELVNTNVYERKENSVGGFFEYAFDNLDDLTIYDTVPPPLSRRGDYVHPDLPEIQTPPPVPEQLRDYELEDELMEVNRLIHETLKKIEKLKHRRNVTNFVRQEAVKRRARELGIRLSRYTVGSLLDSGHDVGDVRIPAPGWRRAGARAGLRNNVPPV